MYGQIHAVHAQLVDARRAAKFSVAGIRIDPKLMFHLEDAVFFLAGQCLALNAAVSQLQEQLNERGGNGDGSGKIIVEAGLGSGGPGGG
jgi:hypothetical protein